MNPHEFDLVEGRRARLCDQGLLVCRLQVTVSYFKLRELFILHNVHGPTLSKVRGCGEPREFQDIVERIAEGKVQDPTFASIRTASWGLHLHHMWG